MHRIPAPAHAIPGRISFLGAFAPAPVGTILPFGAVWEGVEPKVVSRMLK